MTNLRKMSALTLAISAAAVTGCSSDSDSNNESNQNNQQPGTPSETNNTYQTLTIDASDYTDYVYFNLDTNSEVALTAEEAASSSEWHIGLRRTAIIVNGGDSGSGNVEAALAEIQEDFYNDESEADSNVFMNATADSEEEHLLASYELSTLEFSSDQIVPAIEGSQEDIGGGIYDYGWYFYNFNTHGLSVNDDNWWLLKSNTGTSFAKFRASEYDRTEGLQATFEFNVQAEGTTEFSAATQTFEASISAEGGEVCYDFDTDATVDCTSSSDWDLKVDLAGRSQNLWINGGVTADGNGGAFGPFSSEDITGYTAGDSVNDTNISRHYSTDSTQGVFSEASWYAYSLAGNHKLWPNFRTYIVDTNASDETAAKYKLQVTNYYSALDTSGHVTIRYEAN